jgi:hypothetical protein
LGRYFIHIILFSLCVFFSSFVYAAAIPTIHLDQPNFILLEHTDSITYTDTTRAGAIVIPDAQLTVTLSNGQTQGPFTITLNEEPSGNGVFTSPMLNFTSAVTNELNKKYHADIGSSVTVGVGSQTSSVTIKDKIDQAINLPIPPISESSTINCSPDFGGDADNDGICDNWEHQTSLDITYPLGNPITYHFNCDTTCDNSARDIFVEIDWMEGHRPNQLALDDVVTAFKNAFQTGTGQEIRVHLQVDPEPIPHLGCIVWGTSGITFDKIKANFFGTPSERSDAAWHDISNTMYIEKKQAFHYALFAHGRCGVLGETGKSEISGNDLEVTLGRSVGSRDQQSGTFMHELGHNLGLLHGGNTNINCKPNYLSVMSHSRQFADLVNNRKLDYSHQALGYNPNNSPTTFDVLPENPLNEAMGVELYSSPNEIMVWGNPTTNRPEFSPTGQNSVDWNRNSVRDVTASINVNSIKDSNNKWVCNSPSLELLTGFDDWSNISVNVRNSYDSLDGRNIDLNDDTTIRNAITNIESLVASNPGISHKSELEKLVSDAKKEETTKGYIWALGTLSNYARSHPDSGDMDSRIREIIDTVINPNNILATSYSVTDENIKAMRVARIDTLEEKISDITKTIPPEMKDSLTNIKNYIEQDSIYNADAELQTLYSKLSNINLITQSKDRKELKAFVEDTLDGSSKGINDHSIVRALKSPKIQLSEVNEPKKVQCKIKMELLTNKEREINKAVCVTEGTAEILKMRNMFE